ncbi:MAG: RNA-binding protein [Mariprofundaceae bacterium]|nr:RNA-binding protein [Mariprofundaceae bacterium]
MSILSVIKLCAVAATLSLVGYYTMPILIMVDTPEPSIFATGLFFGVLLGGMFAGLSSFAKCKSDNSNVLYVGNIPFNAREDEIQRLFEAYGTVKAVRLVTGGPSKRPKGYGFIEMDNKGAIEALALNGSEFGGRKLRVNAAKSKTVRE